MLIRADGGRTESARSLKLRRARDARATRTVSAIMTIYGHGSTIRVLKRCYAILLI